MSIHSARKIANIFDCERKDFGSEVNKNLEINKKDGAETPSFSFGNLQKNLI